VLRPPARHNGRVRRPGLLLAAAACVGVVLVGCSDAPSSSDGQESESPSGSATDDLLVPEGVELTPEGTELSVGDVATVGYEPRQGVVGVLDIKVTRLEKTTFEESFAGWDLDAETKESNPYFVRATVTNRGETDLGERPVPLYIVDGNDTLVEATSFSSTFKPCSPGSFPKKFGPAAAAKVCLVYLSPKKGDLTAVSFRPTPEDLPITWTGELKEPRPEGNKDGHRSRRTDGGGG
jgi:hypothetical protein